MWILPVQSSWCFTYRQTDHWSRSTAQCSTLLFGRWSQSRLILVDGWPPGWTSWFKWNYVIFFFFLTVLPIGEKGKKIKLFSVGKSNALWEASVISIFPVDAATVLCHSTRFVVQRLVGFTSQIQSDVRESSSRYEEVYYHHSSNTRPTMSLCRINIYENSTFWTKKSS